jgi:hypothetical protein
MRLWGKVVTGMMLVMAAVFAVVAIMAPEARRESLGAAVVLAAAALIGIPALVRFFVSFTGDEEVLKSGVVGSATITSLKPTRWHYNRYYPIVRFGLSVEAGGARYPIEIKQAVDPKLLQRLAPGVVVGLRVDREKHKKVVIDWREPIRAATDADKDLRMTEGAQASVPSSEQKQPVATPASFYQPVKGFRWLFIGGIALFLSLIFFRLSCEEGYYEKGAVRVQGMVLQKTYSPGTHPTRSVGAGSAGNYYVRYKFTTSDGRTVEDRYEVLPDTWRRLKEGGPVVIEYLPGSPETNRIPAQRAESGTFRILALGVLFAGLIFIGLGLRKKVVHGHFKTQWKT